MEEQTLSFNENQFKRTGFAEAFTPILLAQMEQGQLEIKHPFIKQFEGDTVKAMLYLKKAQNTEFYFLNKFDLSLQKEGQTTAQALKQTFYITRRSLKNEEEPYLSVKHDNKFTLKESYNLLSGRPAFKELMNKDGEVYQAWVKLNFSIRNPDGNYEMKQYTQGYGFDLEYVLGKYSILELKNEAYKKALIESLHRGNLQKVTFKDKDGNQENLYISPNITLGVLNVFDGIKKKLHPFELSERGWIELMFVGRLQERIEEIKAQRLKHQEEQKPNIPDKKLKPETPASSHRKPKIKPR